MLNSYTIVFKRVLSCRQWVVAICDLFCHLFLVCSEEVSAVSGRKPRFRYKTIQIMKCTIWLRYCDCMMALDHTSWFSVDFSSFLFLSWNKFLGWNNHIKLKLWAKKRRAALRLLLFLVPNGLGTRGGWDPVSMHYGHQCLAWLNKKLQLFYGRQY